MADRKKAKKKAQLRKDQMKCNKPRRDVQGGKKFVVKACENGKKKLLDLVMQIWKLKRQSRASQKLPCSSQLR